MKSLSATLKEHPIFTTGIFFALAFSLFFLFEPSNDRWRGSEIFTAQFLFTYIGFVFMFITVVADNKEVTGKLFKFYNLRNNLMLLVLGNVSAYALNRQIQVFQPSADWLSWFLVLLNLAVVQVALRKDYKPNWLTHLSVAMMGAGTLHAMYGVIYLWYSQVFGVLMGWFFGISLHLLVPIWWALALGLLLRKMLTAYPVYFASMLAGIGLPLIFIISFTVRWSMLGNEVSKVYHEEIAPLDKKELPNWVRVGQRIQQDWMTKQILADEGGRNQFGADFIFPSGINKADGTFRHDPIVGIARTLSPHAGMGAQQANTLKEILFEARHATEPRLWSGDDLRTNDVVTNVEFFPEHRLSYTEKTLTIKHLGGWPQTQEALYSFYLPEGGVVTSASLWIFGKEQKAILTTKAKAEEAYETIVGKERRDPLLVTWKEGNRVTARIFPCSPDSIRQFKIGITAPLRHEDGKLHYENIRFDGPEADAAAETVRLVGDIMPTASNLNFEETGNYKEHKGQYQPAWTLELAAPPLSEQPFSFNGKTFQVRPLPEVSEPFSYKRAYLDLNNSWSKREFNEIYYKLKESKTNVFVCPDGCYTITEVNKHQVFDQMNKLNFSVFPLHKVEQPDQSVVITKAGGSTPSPGDLQGSDYFEQFAAFYKNQGKPIKLLSLGQKSSLWFTSLAAARAVQLVAVSTDEALELIEKQQFPANQEDGETIVVQQAGIKIKQVPNSEVGSKAPDHLMRLFAYNDLMKSLGKNYFDAKGAEENMLAAAQEAWVVTPFSSLITLETQADYDRFDIKAPDGNSLKNASISNSGAVPEPHEWLLAFLCLAMTWVLYQRSKQRAAYNRIH
ncbi:MAG: XrtN system VIT domain-containing protein [Saprospiraceae bacterium]|nr:XrtN system VIT domain-containing protein [Saprospiraceae bacterium]